MKKRLKNYLSYLKGINIKEMSEDEKADLRDELLIQTGFFQHERLVHLIVTVTIAILTILSFFGCIKWPNVFLFMFSGLLAFLLIAYIVHYYTLENGVQELYEHYDRMIKKR